MRLSEKIQAELTIPLAQVVYWTDSTSVIHYIRNESRRFHTFVANRVAEIQRCTIPLQWRHVQTDQNPADEGTRGLNAREFLDESKWLKGPEFLWQDETHWPEPPDVLYKTDDEMRGDPEVRNVGLTSTKPATGETESLHKLLSAFSSWTRLKKAVGWLIRFKNCLRHRVKPGSDQEHLVKPVLSVGELKNAEQEIVRLVQVESFQKEMETLQKSPDVRLNGQLQNINPMLVDGVLRVGGRLPNAPISQDVKHPVILPHKSNVTKLIIEHHHNIVGHSGPGATWTSLREKYWVLRGGATVRHVIGKCFECRKRNASMGEQIMAELPAARVTPDSPPFTNTGIDYFGPIYVKQGRKEVKRYRCLFTCLAVRAVHIEVTHLLDTSSFINALRRFVSRRGVPKAIYSDNGTNFVGSERELRESIKQFNQQKIQSILVEKEIEWHFNPPLASHMGGVWERMVKSVKKVLKAVLKEQVVNDETLLTVMAEVEMILNSRPITQIHQDARDDEPLTPNHMLLLRPSGNLPPGVFDKSDVYGIRRWRQVQYLADQFWRRWLREYLPMLQVRQKWCTPRRNLQKGDLVLVVEIDAPRAKWPLGIVVQTYPDKAAWVRQVDVRVRTKCIRRPIAKLCFLESTW